MTGLGLGELFRIIDVGPEALELEAKIFDGPFAGAVADEKQYYEGKLAKIAAGEAQLMALNLLVDDELYVGYFKDKKFVGYTKSSVGYGTDVYLYTGQGKIQFALAEVKAGVHAERISIEPLLLTDGIELLTNSEKQRILREEADLL